MNNLPPIVETIPGSKICQCFHCKRTRCLQLFSITWTHTHTHTHTHTLVDTSILGHNYMWMKSRSSISKGRRAVTFSHSSVWMMRPEEAGGAMLGSDDVTGLTQWTHWDSHWGSSTPNSYHPLSSFELRINFWERPRSLMPWRPKHQFYCW